ncbi:hypothetical protein DFH09DRAFT_1435549 [Mycena vulgaris]|nr:hypothetical protein DFH09DRAFT_1435549 [Mycena vulgaris]
MPIITNSSGFQIHGGAFYEVSGDVNLETHQHLTMRQEQRLLHAGVGPPKNATVALDDGWSEAFDRELSGVARNPRQRMVAGPAPYARAPHPDDHSESSPRRPARPSGHEAPDQGADLLGGDSRLVDPTRLIHGGTYISAENINHRYGEAGIHILHRAVTLDALYDSAESFPQPRCHPETREEMLNSLYNWAVSETSTRSIRWLHGPAGAGKSAIMQSLCHRLQQAGHLGGSFFFKRGHHTRGSARALFTTLAYQLALSNRDLKPLISWVVEDDPSVMARHMDIQLHKLIVEPCQSLNSGAFPILLIDGLDECEGNHVQQEILCLLGDIAAHPNPLRPRLLIASRPESHIREKFDSIQGLYDSVELNQSFMDVENYLRSEFDRIHREHHDTMAAIPAPWPPSRVLRELVANSSGYFIYAATIIKFVDDRDFRPTQRLAVVVQNIPTECGGSPYHALDELYLQILRDVPFQSRIIDILCVIIHGSDIMPTSRTNIEQLLGLDPGDLALALRRLHSLLLVPSRETQSISLHHKSFRDFLLDPNRSGTFYLGLERRKELARSVLRTLSQSSACVSSTHVAWSIGPSGLDFITSAIPPSADLSSLLQTVNLDFVWNWSWVWKSRLEGHVGAVITWLKKCSPRPELVIDLWENYRVIIRCGSISEHRLVPAPRGLSDAACHVILSQSPELLRVVQAWGVWNAAKCDFVSLVHIKFLLDIPWDELAACIGTLRFFLGKNEEVEMQALLIYTIRSTTICPEAYPWPTTCRDVARGCIRLLKVQDHRLPDYHYRRVFSCFDIHDILQWLKGFSQPPLDVIHQWEGYQARALRYSKISAHELEEPWIACLDRMRNVQNQRLL